LRSVKRLVELTLEDLVAHPVWRYEGGSGAAAAVVPSRRKTLSTLDDEIFLAATDFDLFDASGHLGFCFPGDDSGIDYLQPVIILEGWGHVNFWFENPVLPAVLTGQWNALGKEPSQIFPVAFRCRVPVDGRAVSGQISRVESSQDLTSGPPARTIAETPSNPRASDGIPAARPVQARRDTGPIEKRATRRRKADMTVEFTQGNLQGTGVIGNVSPRGMFVRSTRIPGAGPMLRLKVNLPEGRTLVLTGRVVRDVKPTSRSAHAPGFGLRIMEDSSDYEDLLSRLRNKPK
jgi:hypothetical protein